MASLAVVQKSSALHSPRMDYATTADGFDTANVHRPAPTSSSSPPCVLRRAEAAREAQRLAAREAERDTAREAERDSEPGMVPRREVCQLRFCGRVAGMGDTWGVAPAAGEGRAGVGGLGMATLGCCYGATECLT